MAAGRNIVSGGVRNSSAPTIDAGTRNVLIRGARLNRLPQGSHSVSPLNGNRIVSGSSSSMRASTGYPIPITVESRKKDFSRPARAAAQHAFPTSSMYYPQYHQRPHRPKTAAKLKAAFDVFVRERTFA